jgi:hypothetical protein
VVWNMFYFPFHIWDNPSHCLSYFSRWLKPPTRYTVCWWITISSRPIEAGLFLAFSEPVGRVSKDGLAWLMTP